MADNVFYCDRCGGVMEFDVKTQMLKCPNCDTTVAIENNKEDIVEHTLTNHAMQTLKSEQKNSSTMECKGCGAKIEVAAHQSAIRCPYCGSSYVLAKKQEEVIIPDGVVPFKIDKNGAKEIMGRWIKKRYLAPGELKTLYQRGDLFGMYVPYWTFDADAKAQYTGMGGRYRTEHYKDRDGNTRTRTVTDWYPTRGFVHTFFDDVLVSASTHHNRYLLSGMDDYDTRQLVSYAPDYFSGYGAETFNVNLDDAHTQAIDMMQNQLRELARQDILRRYDTARDIHIHTNYSQETYKHVLLPVYTITYHYKDKIYNVLVNGQTGTIKGQYPKSVWKIILIILATAMLLFGAIYLYSGMEGRRDYRDYIGATEFVDENGIICYDNIEITNYFEEV